MTTSVTVQRTASTTATSPPSSAGTVTGAATLARLQLRLDRVRSPLWLGGIIALVLVSAGSVAAMYPEPQDVQSYVDLMDLSPNLVAVNRALNGPGLGFERGECSAFTTYALVGRMQRLDPADVSQLLEVRLFDLVDGVRVLDDLGKGPDVYEPAVTERIVERLGLGLRGATSKLSLPYALARAKVLRLVS